MDTFGERLKIAREEKGFNQKEFAEAIGVTPTRLNYWEKDKREPDFPHIRKIIDILDCDADYLLGTKFSRIGVDEVKKQVQSSIIEDQLKSLILSKYKSIREFSLISDLPYSTIDTILKSGVQKSSITNIIKIYKILGLNTDALADNQIITLESKLDSSDLTQQEQALLKKYRALDERGKRSVDIVLNDQYDCLYPESEKEIG